MQEKRNISDIFFERETSSQRKRGLDWRAVLPNIASVKSTGEAKKRRWKNESVALAWHKSVAGRTSLKIRLRLWRAFGKRPSGAQPSFALRSCFNFPTSASAKNPRIFNWRRQFPVRLRNCFKLKPSLWAWPLSPLFLSGERRVYITIPRCLLTKTAGLRASIERCTFQRIRAFTKNTTLLRATLGFAFGGLGLPPLAFLSAGINGIPKPLAWPPCRAPRYCFSPRQSVGFPKKSRHKEPFRWILGKRYNERTPLPTVVTSSR